MPFKPKITSNITPLTDIQKRDVETLNRLLQNKEKQSKSTAKSSVNIVDRYSAIRTQISQIFKDDITYYTCIHTYKDLCEYVSKCLQNGIVAIDTETTSLDPLTTQLVGFSLYTPNESRVYIPVNHIGYVTQLRLSDQVTEQEAQEQLKLLSKCKTIFHNAKFDIRVIKNTLGVEMIPFWDTFIASKLIREDESSALKFQYSKVFEGKSKKEYDFDSLFGGLDFRAVPLDIASVYGAADAYKTYMLYEYQLHWFNLSENSKVYNVFQNIEMPLIKPVADMEDTGLCLNVDTCSTLSTKYHERALLYKQQCESMIEDLYGQAIRQFKIKYPVSASKLSTPISITSPIQLSILIYDIMGLEPADPRNPRSTGEDVIKMFGDKLPFGKLLLDFRHNLKLLSTYIDKLPDCLNAKTNKIHASFHQYGAATGRFSSSDPNLQNIPAKGESKEIRHIFTSSPGYKLVGSDFSQQELKILCHFCNDPNLRHANDTGKDIYAWMASIVNKMPYEDCLEFYPEGTHIVVDGKEVVTGKKTHTNWEGKRRRASMKTVTLAILYGQSVQSTAEQLNISKQEAQNLWDTFFREFPEVRKFMHESQDFARKNGYVETVFGRRRHLPDMTLDPYTYERIGFASSGFNVTFDDDVSVVDTFELECIQLNKALTTCKWWKEKQNIMAQAKSRGIKVTENTMKISDAERQCVNSRIQGTAADVTKLAMLDLYNNEELTRLGYRMLMCIHDEIIGECPEENVKRVSELVPQVMAGCVKKYITVPMKCDVAVSTEWEGE